MTCGCVFTSQRKRRYCSVDCYKKPGPKPKPICNIAKHQKEYKSYPKDALHTAIAQRKSLRWIGEHILGGVSIYSAKTIIHRDYGRDIYKIARATHDLTKYHSIRHSREFLCSSCHCLLSREIMSKGRCNVCKPCTAIHTKSIYRDPTKGYREKNLQWKKNHPDKVREYKKRYAKKHPSAQKYSHEKYLRYREKRAITAHNYYLAHREEIATKARKRYARKKTELDSGKKQ
jgi:hypothetical protein